MFVSPTQMEPLYPERDREVLIELGLDLLRQSSGLRESLHPETRSGVAHLLRNMNSYYSNLIEAHHTHPLEIERALENQYSHDPGKRALQIESRAHVEVERLLEERLARDPGIDIFEFEFLSWIHREFYDRLPGEFRRIQNPATGREKTVVPGTPRDQTVKVGEHIPPAPEALPDFLRRFHSYYGGMKDPVSRIVAIGAAHHRLVWIHPFLDGNGRVARLFTRACLIKTGTDGSGLWSPSRGFARNREAYLNAMAAADRTRKGDLDGRGKRSDAELANFCLFFLKTCLDQIAFMHGLLALDGFQTRIQAYVDRQAALGKMKHEAGYILRDVFLRGKIQRGEVGRITGLPDRTARDILRKLLEQGFLKSDSPRGPLTMGFPLKAVGYYFPRLYPEGIELDLEREDPY